MKRIELQDTELQTASDIVKKYREAEVELNAIQQQLISLDEQKTDLLNASLPIYVNHISL